MRAPGPRRGHERRHDLGGRPERLRFEWGGGVVRFLRNGVEVDRADYSASGYGWGPTDMHFSIGSSRTDGVGSGMPVGAVFSDLVVDTVDGPIVSCPGPPATADGGATWPDGGACDASEVANARVTAASWETGVYSVPRDLNVEADGTGAPTGVVYLRFPPVAGPVSHATLSLHTQAAPSAGGGSGQVCRVDDDTWDEATLTWATRPTPSTTCSGGAHTVGLDEEVEWDVTSLIRPGANQDFAIVSADADGAHYYSRESASCTLAPSLHVELAPPTPDAGVVDASTAMDAGSATDAATPTDAGRDAGSAHHPVSGGCCRVAGGPTERVPALLALVVVGTVVRRRIRR